MSIIKGLKTARNQKKQDMMQLPPKHCVPSLFAVYRPACRFVA